MYHSLREGNGLRASDTEVALNVPAPLSSMNEMVQHGFGAESESVSSHRERERGLGESYLSVIYFNDSLFLLMSSLCAAHKRMQ